MLCIFPFDFWFWTPFVLLFQFTNGKTWIFSNAGRWSISKNLNIFFIGYLTIDPPKVLILGHSIVRRFHLFLIDDDGLNFFVYLLCVERLSDGCTFYVVPLIFGTINLTDYTKDIYFTPLTYVASILSRIFFLKNRCGSSKMGRQF